MLPNNSLFSAPIEKWPADWNKLVKELQPIEKNDPNLWKKLVTTHLSSEPLGVDTEAAYKMFYQHFWVNVLPKIKKDANGFIQAAGEGYDIYIRKWLTRLPEKERIALINTKSNVGDTALHRACDENHVATVKVLLENKAKLNARGLSGETPLHRAAYNNSIVIMDLLLKSGASCEVQRSDDAMPIHVAVFKGSLQAVERLIKHNPAQLNIIGREGQTPLYCAANAGRIPVMSLLLSLGANPNQINKYTGYNILHLAALNNNPDIITAVAEYKPDFNSLDRNGLSPLALCGVQRHGSPEATQAFIRALADYSMKATK